MGSRPTSRSCWGGAAPRCLSATTTRVLGALQKITQSQKVRPEAAASEHPGREAGSWPRTSTGPGMVAGRCCHRWHRSHTEVSTFACSSPPKAPLDFIKFQWGMGLANVPCMREGTRRSLAKQSNAMGRRSPWDHHAEMHQVLCSLGCAPSQWWDGQRDPWASWTPRELAACPGEQHTPP